MDSGPDPSMRRGGEIFGKALRAATAPLAPSVPGWGLCFPRSPKARDLGHPFFVLGLQAGWGRVVVPTLFAEKREKDGAPTGGGWVCGAPPGRWNFVWRSDPGLKSWAKFDRPLRGLFLHMRVGGLPGAQKRGTWGTQG